MPCLVHEETDTVVAVGKGLTSVRFGDRETVLIGTVFNLDRQTFLHPQIRQAPRTCLWTRTFFRRTYYAI